VASFYGQVNLHIDFKFTYRYYYTSAPNWVIYQRLVPVSVPEPVPATEIKPNSKRPYLICLINIVLKWPALSQNEFLMLWWCRRQRQSVQVLAIYWIEMILKAYPSCSYWHIYICHLSSQFIFQPCFSFITHHYSLLLVNVSEWHRIVQIQNFERTAYKFIMVNSIVLFQKKPFFVRR
jgi:hypothetical protein